MEIDTQTIHEYSGGIWKDTSMERKFRKLSPTKLRNLGIKDSSLMHVDTLEELKKNPPNIIIAEAVRNAAFVQNFAQKQKLKKRHKYVMGLGVFQQLYYDINTNKTLLKPSTSKFKKFFTPYAGQELHNKTILVFRTGGIGDLLFIKPNLNYLKEKYPTCTIKFACGPQYQPMTRTWDCIDELLDLPFEMKHLLQADYHVLFEGVIERCKQAHRDNSYNLFSKWMGLDLPDKFLVPHQKADPELVEECRKQLDKWGIIEEGFILGQLRASSPIRTPRHEFWVELFDKLTDRGFNIVLTDSPHQAEAVDDFIKLCKNSNKVFNYCKHSTTLDRSIALTSLSSMTLTTDSAFGHIAASLDIPSYGIYGPFPGYIRLKTYPKARWVDAHRHCAPCFIHGHTPCPEASSDGYSPCYDNIDKDRVVDEIEGILKND